MSDATAPTGAPGVGTPAVRRGRWRFDRELLLLVGVALVLNLTGITWGLPNGPNDWANDSIAPLGPLYYAQRMLTEGHWWFKYPPLHFTLLAVFSAPYLAFLALTGGLDLGASEHLYGLARADASLTLLTLLARSVSAVMGVGATSAVYLIGRELAGRRAGLLAGLLFAASPLTIYYAHTANLDMPYLFWSSLALLCLVRIARGAPPATYVGFGFFAAAAVATKDQAYGLFALLPIPLLLLHLRRSGSRALLDRRLLLGFAVAVVTYLLAANVLIDFDGWRHHLRYITNDGSQPFRMFEANTAGYAALVRRTAALTVRSTTPLAAGLALLGLVCAVRGRLVGAGLLLFAALSYLVIFLGPILYVLPRFVLPAVLVLAVFAGIGGAWLWDRGRTLARVTVVATVAWALAYGATMNVGMMLDSRYQAEAWMAAHLPVDAVVGTNGTPTYLPRLPGTVTSVPFDLGGDLDTERPDFLVLSDAYYRRHLRRDPSRSKMLQLLSGERDYEPVATFERRRLPATALIPTVNPRIVILRRRALAVGGAAAEEART